MGSEQYPFEIGERVQLNRCMCHDDLGNNNRFRGKAIFHGQSDTHRDCWALELLEDEEGKTHGSAQWGWWDFTKAYTNHLESVEPMLRGSTYTSTIKVDEAMLNDMMRWTGSIQWRDDDEVIIKPKQTIMQKLNLFVKKLLDQDLKTLIKAGYVDECLNLTEAGRQALTAILFFEKKAELVKAAEEKLAEEKEEKDNK